MSVPVARSFDPLRLLPLIGPLALFALWYLTVSLQLVSPVLLPRYSGPKRVINLSLPPLTLSSAVGRQGVNEHTAWAAWGHEP